MSQVIVTNQPTTIDVTENGHTAVVNTPQTSTVTTVVAGPQGPVGPQGPPGPEGLYVNDVAKVDKSLVYYDASAQMYKADSILTATTLTDGGAF